MSTTKHTPKAWSIDGRFEGQTCIIVKDHASGAEPIICRIFDSSHIPLSEQEANARLIAAAPELLEALQDAMKVAIHEEHPFRSWHNKAKAAIAKATGTNA
jgi:hypothetical protein